MLSDFTILIIPIHPLWKLQTPLKRKLGVITVFATGFLYVLTQGITSSEPLQIVYKFLQSILIVTHCPLHISV